MIERTIAELRKSLEQNQNVLLAYLFGSRAKKKGSKMSDYDLAVILKEKNLSELGDVIFTASKTLKVPEDKIDVLDLAKAPLHLKARVLAEGMKLVDRGHEKALKLEVNLNYPRIAPGIRRLIKDWLEDPESLDVRLIKDRLDYLFQMNEHLGSFFNRRGPEAISKEPEAWHALKSMVQDSTQAIIDICAHVFSSKNLGIAESYGEYVDKLAGGGFIDRWLAEKLKLAITMRNRLIHRYLTVEPEELWKFANGLKLEVTPKFREWILKILREEVGER